MTPTFIVTEAYAGKSVYTILRREFKFSAALIRRLKHTNGFIVNGIPVFSNHLLSTGDVLTADIMSAEPSCDIVPENGKIDVLFENDGLIAVNKPSGILIHPSRAKYTGTLANFVSGYLLNKENCGVCHAVNRLDRDTSGVVLFAKNSYMKDIAAKALADETSAKEYIAIAYGKFPNLHGTINLPIKRFEEGNMLRVTAPDGKPAITHYTVINESNICGEDVSVLKLVLETGRTHQIRVHCKAIGHPLLGDILYYTDSSKAASEKLMISAQALHAEKLIFIEPLSDKKLEITAPLARNDMRNIMKIL